MKTKQILQWSVLSASTLFIVGCGGSSSDVGTSVATGQAFYIDSAVSGVDYSCGGQTGVTGSKGEFTFEVGHNCTFSLDKIKLREVAADQLQNGKEIQEKSIDVARVLLSLDSDHNPDNGIQVDSGLVKSLVEFGMTKFEDILNGWYAVIPGFSLVSDAVAKAHLIQSIVKEKTLYTNSSAQMGTLESWSFSADLSTVKVVEIEGGNDEDTISVHFDENNFTFTSASGDSIVINNITESYFLIAINGDETRLYYDEAEARAYFLK